MGTSLQDHCSACFTPLSEGLCEERMRAELIQMGRSGKEAEFDCKQKNVSNEKRWDKMVGAFVGDVGSSSLGLGLPILDIHPFNPSRGRVDYIASESFQFYVSRSIQLEVKQVSDFKTVQTRFHNQCFLGIYIYIYTLWTSVSSCIKWKMSIITATFPPKKWRGATLKAKM